MLNATRLDRPTTGPLRDALPEELAPSVGERVEPATAKGGDLFARFSLVSGTHTHTLLPTTPLSTAQIAAHHAFYDRVGVSLERLRKAGDGLRVSDLDRLVARSPDDLRVAQATTPQPGDSDPVGERRERYRQSFEDVLREETRARREAERLGPGTHERAGGERVTIEHEGARTRVSTRRPDGTERVVSVDADRPERSLVTLGEGVTLERNGTKVRRGDDGRQSTYDVGPDGHPVEQDNPRLTFHAAVDSLRQGNSEIGRRLDSFKAGLDGNPNLDEATKDRILAQALTAEVARKGEAASPEERSAAAAASAFLERGDQDCRNKPQDPNLEYARQQDRQRASEIYLSMGKDYQSWLKDIHDLIKKTGDEIFEAWKAMWQKESDSLDKLAQAWEQTFWGQG